MSARRVVVTGMGMVTPLGAGVQTCWQALLAGQSGIRPIQRFDASGFPVTFAAEVPSLPGEDEADLKLRLTELALREALDMAGPLGQPPDRIGVSVGSEAARPALQVLSRQLHEGRTASAEELARGAPHRPTERAAQLAGAQGPRTTISTACTSSAQAVGEGLLRIRRGEVDAMIVGGVDALVHPLMITGFSLLGALSTRNEAPDRASRPFDVERDGFVLGEGAGFLVLEDERAALARGAEPLVILSGYGCSCNAWRITDSPPDGRGAAQAMTAALHDAGLPPEAVGYVNAHGTSTGQNDVSESRGIRRSFGSHQPAVSSTKSMMGHLVAACGAVEAIITAMAVRHGAAPMTRNLEHPDPECELDHVLGEARSMDLEHALSNAFGFGGSNGSLLLSRWTA